VILALVVAGGSITLMLAMIVHVIRLSPDA
jgi:hypothetical protein